MNLHWEAPKLQFTRTGRRPRIKVTIRETPVRLRPGAHDYWTACREAWRASKETDVAVWRKYRRYVESGRYHFAYRKGASRYGFAEAVVALAMQRRGFTCWTGVLLFGGQPVKAGARLQNTLAVERQLKKDGIALPRGLTRHLTPTLKNPDIVAYHSGRREWRFCEVKRDEKVQRGQVAGLTVLHLLTGGSVSIVRLLRGKDVVPREHGVRVSCRAGSQVLPVGFRS